MYLNFVTLSLNFSKKAKDNATSLHKHQIKKQANKTTVDFTYDFGYTAW